MEELPKPLNVEEKYLYAIVKRLDKVIELLENNDEEVETSSNLSLSEESHQQGMEDITKREIIDKLNDNNVEFDPRARKYELFSLFKSLGIE